MGTAEPAKIPRRAARHPRVTCTMNAVPKLPFVPPPFLEESFGSWFYRCAHAYHTTRGELMVGLLSTLGEPPETGSIDWDTAPPAQLLAALARQTPLAQSELEHLIVPRGPATLPRAYRDAYCPECFKTDRRNGVFYTRRTWLDAWTLSCPTHGCLLGRFSGYEYPSFAQQVTSFPHGLEAEDSGERALREKPLVRCVALRPVKAMGATMPKGYCSVARHWYDPAMLQSVVGRDLLILAGSDWADGVWYEVFGYLRTWRELWHDADRQTLCWPRIQHPIGSIDMRIPAAHLAGLIWSCLRESAVARPYADRVIEVVGRRLNMQWVRHPILMDRWPREERERWLRVFGPAQTRACV